MSRIGAATFRLSCCQAPAAKTKSTPNKAPGGATGTAKRKKDNPLIEEGADQASGGKKDEALKANDANKIGRTMKPRPKARPTEKSEAAAHTLAASSTGPVAAAVMSAPADDEFFTQFRLPPVPGMDDHWVRPHICMLSKWPA